MIQEQYPYQLINTFVISVSFNRAKKIPPKLELPTAISIQMKEPGFPRVQVAMKINLSKEVEEDTPFSFNLEVVGLFDYVGPKKEYDKELNSKFAQERALHMLWVYSDQIVKLISSQMGMNPLKLNSPVSFNFSEVTPVDSEKKLASRNKKKQKSPA